MTAPQSAPQHPHTPIDPRLAPAADAAVVPPRSAPPPRPGLFTHQASAAKRALKRMKESPLITLLSLLVIGFALMLPALGYTLLDNLRAFGHNNSGTPQISLFMQLDATEDDAVEIAKRLKAANLGEIRFVTRKEALENLKAADGMGDIIASLPRNPLPDAFIIDPTVPLTQLDKLAESFREWPKVAHVQLDSAWVKRFDAFIRLGNLLVTLLGGVFALGLMAVTFNTIRLQVLSQADEIEVCRLIGATDAFIRRPFLYFGCLQGLLGGVVAVAMTSAAMTLLSGPVAELVRLYGGDFRLHGLGLIPALLLVFFGMALGWLGARVSVGLALRSVA